MKKKESGHGGESLIYRILPFWIVSGGDVIGCATSRSNFDFHRRIMNRYANPRIRIITHSCDIVFSHAVNRTWLVGPWRRGPSAPPRPASLRFACRPASDPDKNTESRTRQLQLRTPLCVYVAATVERVTMPRYVLKHRGGKKGRVQLT